MSTYIIAEAGRSHDGDFEHAGALVDAAHAAGATAVKFQFWSSAERLAARRSLADAAPYRVAAMPVVWLAPLALKAHALGLDFLCSVFLPEDIATVAPLVAKFKVASLEAQDVDFVEQHLPYGKDVLVSTGCMDGVPDNVMLAAYNAHGRIKLLHCTSAYPCPAGDANVAVLRRNTRLEGFSDHTVSIQSGALAVACGATIIEKHLRLGETRIDNPDWLHSLSPIGFAAYVREIRQAEVLLGDGVKRVMASEAALVPHVVRP